MTTCDYRRKAEEAMASPKLQTSLQGLQQRIGQGAMKIWEEMEDQEMRGRVKRSRLRTLENLDIVLTRLAEGIRARGGQVFFAANAEEASQYTLEVARRNQVKTVVKGKSMTSMEVSLDPVLEAEGIEVVETDLGEYIVQLAEEPPSHIIAPCIHKDRQAIGQLFAEKLGIEYSEDPHTLTMAARKALRTKLTEADMGIVGCNLACAASGQISLVSNEGNIRMSTTMPKVVVSLMGMERVAASLSEHRETLQLLTRAASLQKLSTYVSFLGGPTEKGECDGPQEFHLVIIDNGRSKILADPEFKEVLACIRCGACLNICPVYGKIGGHAYSSVYPGPIGAVITPLLFGVNRHADLCQGETLCGACKDVCPVENDLPRMLAALRHKLAYGNDHWNVSQKDPLEAQGFSIFRAVVQQAWLYRLLLRGIRLALRPFTAKDGQIHKIKGPASAWTSQRDLPPLARESFHEGWRKRQPASPLPARTRGEQG